jgi:hypothetical protein
VSPSNEPRLGLFWFIAKDRGPSRFASLSRPFSGVSEVAGFKTLDEGHVDIWPTVQRLDQSLADYEYDYFPRGWRAMQNLRRVIDLDQCASGQKARARIGVHCVVCDVF